MIILFQVVLILVILCTAVVGLATGIDNNVGQRSAAIAIAAIVACAATFILL